MPAARLGGPRRLACLLLFLVVGLHTLEAVQSRRLLQCVASSMAVAGSSGGGINESVSKAVGQSFTDCRALPKDQSCDAVAQAQAKVGWLCVYVCARA